MPRVHIIGAGLAGLSAAVRLAEAGYRVQIYEAGPHAGGRCRSYFDERLGCRIDNGNHLLLSGNRAALAYLRTVGAADTLTGPADALFPFVDLGTGERWTLAPGPGRVPFWLLDRRRRVPGTRLGDYLSAVRFATAGVTDTVAAAVGDCAPLYERFWRPLAVSILNTEAEAGSARLLWPVLKETLGRGAGYCKPLIARDGLSESFVDPALAWLKLRGAKLMTATRVRSIAIDGAEVTGLETGGGTFPVERGDRVVLAVPPTVAAELLPGLTVPTEFRPILNAHFRLADEHHGGVEIIGVVGGLTEWIFRRGGLVSVTVSAATGVMDDDTDELARRLWAEIETVLGLTQAIPPYRVIKERRATFAQTPAQLALRPAAMTAWRQIVLAGDWTDTGLPATIEGAIRSGATAAESIRAATNV